jgi:hypothetical protein
MDRNMSETKELDAIMRANADVEDPDPVSIPNQPSGEQNPDTNKLVESIIQQVDKVVSTRISEIDQKVNKALGTLEVTQFSMSDPDFEAKVKPVAYQISKEPGKANWPIKDLVEHAKGRIAQDTLKTLQEENTALKGQVSEFQGLASLSDRPNSFGGVIEPAPEMDKDEAFNDAWKKEGLGS